MNRSLRICLFGLVCFTFAQQITVQAADRPNILWITSEDNGPELGCYGDDYADSPNIDALAADGLRYLYCWSNAPVCAPARTTIITGMYPASLGADGMRSQVPMPEGFRMFPQYLREAGYYCTNNSKEDYNLIKPDGVWDASSGKAHWKHREKGQPFFAVINHTVSHESQIRVRPHTPVHDPAKVKVPAYHPDTPETRRDWAQYYDKITEMDRKVGQNIAELKQAGLYDETIIFYYGDHGSGMPRHKRWPYNSGLHVPLIVRIPEKFKHLAPPEYQTGGTSDRLVSFVDLAPTVLSLCGILPPQVWQGFAFAGPFCAEKQPYVFGFRGRMDERIDMVRSVRNERYVYIRHFYSHRPYGQYLNYMFQTPTTRKWYELHLAGQLNEVQDRFWQPKPIEELYDLQSDPEEIHDLTNDPSHAETLHEMRDVLGKQFLKTFDLGAFPEALQHQLAGDRSPYDVLRKDETSSHYDYVSALAFLATRATLADVSSRDDLVKLFQHESPASRYWGSVFTLRTGQPGVKMLKNELRICLQDESPIVRVAAAEALAQHGTETDLKQALPVLVAAADLNQSDLYTAIAAWNALDFLDQKAASVQAELENLPETSDGIPKKLSNYIPRLKEKLLADLNGLPLP